LKDLSKVLNLQAIPCPLNVVKCKLALEKLSVNETLIVCLDRGEPEEMVKKALSELDYSFTTIDEDQVKINLKIFHGS
tara:strand:- start:592 stop:825 length:234 start_codon:yes stop_codon:yes gene_type:complete